MKVLTRTTHYVDLDESLRFYTCDPRGMRDQEIRAERLVLTASSSLLAKGPEVNDGELGPLTLAIDIDIDELPQNVAVAVLEAVLNA